MLETPLHALHLARGARMVDFGGWDMPLHYGSQLEEHHAVRRDAGMFDVSHMLAIDVAGAGARDLLLLLLANDIDKLKQPGKALYSCMLNDAAGVIDDLIAYRIESGSFRLVVNAGTAPKDLAWMQRQRERIALHVEVTPRRDLAMIAVQGPRAGERLCQAMPSWRALIQTLKPFCFSQFGEYFIARTGYTGEDGFEIALPGRQAQVLWKELEAARVAPAGLGARDTLRLEAGMNLYGQDMDETASPLESGLAWTVDITPGRDFIGKAALLERPVRNKLIGLVLLDRGVLRSHQRVATPHGEGEVTSGGFAPTLELSIALARLPLAVAIGDEVAVSVRDKRLRAKTVKPPFVRNGNSIL